MAAYNKIYQHPAKGKMLIAYPFLSDPNFSRTVIFLCDFSEDGAIGFVINKKTDYELAELLPELVNAAVPIFNGGPVQQDTLHMLHNYEGILEGREIMRGVFWGGDFDAIPQVSSVANEEQTQLKLLLGYSGWSKNQLEDEVKEGSWIITDVMPELLFLKDEEEIWKQAILNLGPPFRHLANSPAHPQLN